MGLFDSLGERKGGKIRVFRSRGEEGWNGEARDETKRLASRRQACRGMNSRRGVAIEGEGEGGDMKAESRNSNTTEMEEEVKCLLLLI